MIAKAASLTEGAGEPSHLEADQFCHMLLSKKFKTEVKELRDERANSCFSKNISISYSRSKIY